MLSCSAQGRAYQFYTAGGHVWLAASCQSGGSADHGIATLVAPATGPSAGDSQRLGWAICTASLGLVGTW